MFLVSSLFFFVWFPCGRLSWLHVSFWAHVNIVYHIISYHNISSNIILCGNGGEVVNLALLELLRQYIASIGLDHHWPDGTVDTCQCSTSTTGIWH